MTKKQQSDSPALFEELKPRTRIIYCGDNLDQLKKLPDGSIDLIYIDPPFNSNRNYEAFWGDTKEKRAFEDRHGSTESYIKFMRPRCVELARVLKQTGSFYYHCDWHAGHYVKVMLDQIFGENQFQSEIIWQRTHAHGSATRWAPIHDSIFFYTNGKTHTWTYPTLPHDPEYVKKHFRAREESGRLFQAISLTGPGKRNGESGKPWRDIDPTSVARHWAIPGHIIEKHNLSGGTVQEKLDALNSAGLIYWPKKGNRTPRLKWFADELGGMAMGTVWTDIPPLSGKSAERLGYPTQKPLALLERIIKASSNRSDLVLDAFCGCGTALVAAENLDRHWIGIDISPTACRVMADRLKKVCGLEGSDDFAVQNLPRSIDQLRKMPHFEFENWAVLALGGQPNKAKVGDFGIDGRIFPVSAIPQGKDLGKFDFMDHWYPIQVKQKDKAGRNDIELFEVAMDRAKRAKGYFVSFDFTRDATVEIGRYFKDTGRSIIALTVQDILDEEIAQKLA